jgi:hypothetical protein
VRVPEPAGGRHDVDDRVEDQLLPGRSGGHATTRRLHIGRTTIVVQTDLLEGRGKRVAHVTQTQAVIQPS